MELINRRGAHELADIFRLYGDEYKKKEKLPKYILKVINAIENCRTSVLGGHVDECDKCGYKRISYNSCRNRHCPKCQSLAREKWVSERQKELLPIKYYHVVLTIPHELNEITLRNKKVMYDILFKSGSQTLLRLGKDMKRLGAEIGLIAVLHTWGQNLMDHPHLHCIVSGGGLSEDGNKWIKPRKSGKKDFFVHVNVISDLYKKKFLYYTKEAYKTDKLKFVGKIGALEDRKEFLELIKSLYTKKWITYCKRPFGGAEAVIKYLGRYTHRVAISNHRIRDIKEGKVIFDYKDYKNGSIIKQMSLDAEEFIRRFLLHVLPEGFYKIRYYGILSSRNKKTKLNCCKELLGKEENNDKKTESKMNWKEIFYELTGIDVEKCPKCKKGRMILIERLIPSYKGP